MKYREEKVYQIIRHERLSAKVHLISLKPESEMFSQVCEFGSYAFLRKASYPSAFSVPISVMDCDRQSQEVSFAFQVVGPKTRALAEAYQAVTVKWPFWGGIAGVKSLKKAVGWKVLIVAKGIAQAAALLTIRKLVERGNWVTYAVGPGEVEDTFTARAAKKLGAEVILLPKEEDHNLSRFKLLLELKPYQLVVSLGPDVQHATLAKLCATMKKRPRFACSNNGVLCCGEGVCGACLAFVDGGAVRRCKSPLTYTL
ncbi:MAG: hypothetical protein ACPLPR_10060 [Bacillota bacterium]